MQEIYSMFPAGLTNERQWILLSTGGLHGSFTSIEDAEYILRGEDPKKQPLSNGRTMITVLIVKPVSCTLLWGEVQVNMDDLKFLRKLVRNSLQTIEKSQKGNI
jgi:hypothetical protein